MPQLRMQGVNPKTSMNTSSEALKSMKAVIPSKRYAVYEYIKGGSHGATCDEVENALELKHQTASARIRELAQMGLIAPRGVRKTRSGRNATVWVKAASV